MWYDDGVYGEGEDVLFGMGRWSIRKAELPGRALSAAVSRCSDRSGILFVSFDPASVCLVCSAYHGRVPPLKMDRVVYALSQRSWSRNIEDDNELHDVGSMPSNSDGVGVSVSYTWNGASADSFIERIVAATEEPGWRLRIGMLRRFGAPIDDRSWFSFFDLDGLADARRAALAVTNDAYRIATASTPTN